VWRKDTVKVIKIGKVLNYQPNIMTAHGTAIRTAIGTAIAFHYSI
jgi:hypothetical protein